MPEEANERAKRILLVVNPVSGDVDKSDFTDEIGLSSKEMNFTCRIYYTVGKRKKDSRAIRGLLKRYHPDRVVAAGGDGTCNLVGKTLLNTGIPMGIVPAGSANGLARELGIPQKLKEAWEVVIRGEEKKMDVLIVNKRFISIHLSDIGLNAKVVERFEQGNLRGLTGYARHFVKALFDSSPLNFKVEMDNRVIRKRAYMAVIANASRYGTGAVVNPKGEINDGYFELLFIRPYTVIQLLKMLVSFFTRPVHAMNYIDTFRCREAVIHNLDLMPVQVDGEIIGRMGKVSVEILPQSLTVLVPPGTGAVG
jgi:YegS/Rv2252/BmrU family lipid kinase